MTAVPKELWGVQPNGFYAPTIEDIVADESADLLSYVDPGLDLEPILRRAVRETYRKTAGDWMAAERQVRRGRN